MRDIFTKLSNRLNFIRAYLSPTRVFPCSIRELLQGRSYQSRVPFDIIIGLILLFLLAQIYFYNSTTLIKSIFNQASLEDVLKHYRVHYVVHITGTMDPVTAFCKSDTVLNGPDGYQLLKLDGHCIDPLTKGRKMYSQEQRIEISGGDPYIETDISIPEELRKDHLYVLKLEYQTAGKANPFPIIITNLFDPEKIILHKPNKPISLSEQFVEKQIVFSPQENTPQSDLILRNWSKEGRFIIKKVEIYDVYSLNNGKK